jgi:hyperosmotically inducible protein
MLTETLTLKMRTTGGEAYIQVQIKEQKENERQFVDEANCCLSLPFGAHDCSSSGCSRQPWESIGERVDASSSQVGIGRFNAAKHATKGTARAMRVTKITAKVKGALHGARISEKSKILVTTTAGVVVLSWRVPSAATAARAEQLAKQTEGVRSVTNDLRVGGPVQSD